MSSELWPYVYAIISGEHGIVDSRDDHVVGTYAHMAVAVAVGAALNSELQRAAGQDPA